MAKSRKKEDRKRQGRATEKKFFKVAIIVTVVLLALVYLMYANS